MRYISIVAGVAFSGFTHSAEILQCIDTSVAGILRLTDKKVVGGLLGEQPWKELWRAAGPTIAAERKYAPAWICLSGLFLVRDRALPDEIFEGFVDGNAFFRRISRLPNAVKLIGDRSDAPNRFKKQLDLFDAPQRHLPDSAP